MSTVRRSSRKNIFQKILIVLLIILVGIQFIRPKQNSELAEGLKDYKHYLNVPDSIHKLLVVSCYDCHSNHTNYPWYSYINPIGLWLNDHIVDGKRHLNFSDFSRITPKRLDDKLKETAELVENGAMPLDSYTWIHKDAVLNEQQVKAIVSWAESERIRLANK